MHIINTAHTEDNFVDTRLKLRRSASSPLIHDRLTLGPPITTPDLKNQSSSRARDATASVVWCLCPGQTVWDMETETRVTNGSPEHLIRMSIYLRRFTLYRGGLFPWVNRHELGTRVFCTCSAPPPPPPTSHPAPSPRFLLLFSLGEKGVCVWGGGGGRGQPGRSTLVINSTSLEVKNLGSRAGNSIILHSFWA